MNSLLEKVNAVFPLREVDAGEFANMKLNGMKFTLSCYDAEGLGRVSFMHAVGMMGLMKMDTMVINPFEKDAPLFSYDRVLAMGNDTFLNEFYDTVLGASFDDAGLRAVQEEGASLPGYDPGEHWYDGIKLPVSTYKKGKKAEKEAFTVLADHFLEAYLKACSEAEICDPAAKKEKARAYTEGLLSHGGPACDIFKKQKGLAFTENLFRDYMFGTGK